MTPATLQRPIVAPVPSFGVVDVDLHGHTLALPYFYRPGTGGPAVLFVHGLGGCKENFHAALQNPALADCTLASFDAPGTGLACFEPDARLDVSALADLSHQVAERLLPGPYFLVGASMGGLITLLQLRRYGVGRVQGLVSLEGNLLAEDCMFSRRVIAHPLARFAASVFDEMRLDLERSTWVGDRVIAQHMAVNVDVRAYHAYSFETVAESDSGRLLDELLALPIPRLFVYGHANRTLSYLPRLRASAVALAEIPDAAHFMFYDNPLATFRAVGDFVHAHAAQPEA